jgi:small subunit ribosomal protein S1
MTNEVTPHAEESETIEKTATEQTTVANEPVENTDAEGQTAEATETPAAETPVAEPETPAAESEPAPPSAASAPAAMSQSTTDDDADMQNSGEIDFGAILEQFESEQTIFHAGELVTGTVVGVSDRGVLVDFGFKSEGFVPIEEFTGPDGEITAVAGESVEVVIRSIHSGDGAPQLSRFDAVGRKVWDEIETAYKNETPITGRVVDKVKGGLRVDLNGVEAFLPGSQIDSRPMRSLDSYLGQDIEAKVIKFSRRRNNIVLSRKVITDETVNAIKAETMSKIDVGYVVDGTINNITEYGAFVDIGGIDGLLHVTDMSWGRIHHPSELFKVNDTIQVKVLKLDREKDKISLGFKQLQPDPWSTVIDVYPVDTKVTGKVSSVTDYGVFVELEAGVEGLVHVSEISWARRAQSPKRMFSKGQDVDVQVLGVDTDERRISLGMKQFQDNPWDTVDLRFPVGSRVSGKVRNITDFGAFVEIEPGIDGLVHISDISWSKKIKHPKDLLKKDQEVEAIITNIDKRNQRLSLSMKDLTPSAWETFNATHRPGDVVRGKVSRFTNFGVFVELSDGLEGLCHISELSDDRVERAEDIAQLGQEMDFKILRIELADQKIGLSARAVGKDDEPIVDSRSYSSEAKGGMASLGELANLRFGSAEDEAPAEEAPAAEKKKSKAKKAEETSVEETSSEESAAVETAPATEEAAAEEAPAEEAAPETEEAVTDAPTNYAAAEETAAEETPAEESEPVGEESQEAPVEESAADEPAAEDAPAEKPEPATAEVTSDDAASEEGDESKSAENGK